MPSCHVIANITIDMLFGEKHVYTPINAMLLQGYDHQGHHSEGGTYAGETLYTIQYIKEEIHVRSRLWVLLCPHHVRRRILSPSQMPVSYPVPYTLWAKCFETYIWWM